MQVEIPPEGFVLHLKSFGFVKVFRTASRDGNAEHWATDDLQMEESTREDQEERCWGWKSTTGASSSAAALSKPR
jgi:putative transposase